MGESGGVNKRANSLGSGEGFSPTKLVAEGVRVSRVYAGPFAVGFGCVRRIIGTLSPPLMPLGDLRR